MAMSKQFYADVARAISRRYAHSATLAEPDVRGTVQGTLLMLAADLATLFADDNVNFDRTRFLKACGALPPR